MSLTSNRAISVLVAAAFCGCIALFFGNTWPPDLSAIYFAARSYGLGEYDLIYKSLPEFFGGSASVEWQQMAAELGHSDVPTLPYVYAPIWAALLAPIATAVGPIAFYNGVLVVHTAALLGSVVLAHRLFAQTWEPRARWWLASGAMILVMSPFFLAFWLNQPHIFVTFLVLLAFERYQSGQMVWAGVILGLATALKLSPLILGVIFLIDRRWTAAVAMAVTGLGLLAASVAIAGIELHQSFVDQLARVRDNVIITPLNFGLEGVIYRAQDLLTGGAENVSSFYIKDASGLVGGVGMAILLLGLLVIWRVRANAPEGSAVGPLLLAVWSLSILCGPLAWAHYLIGPLLLSLSFVLSRKRPWAIVVVVIIVGLLSHPAQRLIASPTADPIWFMSIGAACLALMVIVGLFGLRRQ